VFNVMQQRNRLGTGAIVAPLYKPIRLLIVDGGFTALARIIREKTHSGHFSGC
jgi:hypothetical protein